MITQKNDTYNFYQLTADEGMTITKWLETDDIKDYNAGKVICCPLTTDLSIYYEITDERDAELRARQEEAIKEEMERLP
jgi:hypothetical protein